MEQIYAYLSEVFKLVYGIVAFLLLAGIPINMLVRVLSGRREIFK